MAIATRVLRHWVYLPILVYTIFALFPFVWVASLSLRNSGEIYANPYGLPWPPHFEKYLEVWTKFNYAVFFRNSIVVSVAAVVLGTMAGAMAAFVLSRPRYAFRFREAITILIFLSIMFPPQITLIALFQNLVQYGLYNTLQGLTLVYAAAELPLTVFLLRAFFVQIPGDLEDAARLDGCGDWRMFWQVMFPIARPAVAAVVILNFIGHWNEFLYAVVFISKEELRTLPLAVMFFMGENFQDIGMLATGMMVAILPVALIYIFFSEALIQGMTAGAVKG
jgi:multiple sugar transport system permease protein/raffinose/stachyose/melibiose transport system permease protein